MALRQCVPAALANRSLFPSSDWRIAIHGTARGARRFHSAVCLHGPMPARTRRIRTNATRKRPVTVDSRPAPPPVVSLTGVSSQPNVYRDFSDGDEEMEPQGSVIQLKESSKSKIKKKDKVKNAKKDLEPRSRSKPSRRALRFSDSEDEVDDRVGEQARDRVSDGEAVDEDDDDEDDEEEEEEEGGDFSRKPLLTLPQSGAEGAAAELLNSSRAILYERFVFQHIGDKPTRQLFGSNIFVPENASRVKIHNVEFIKSSDGLKECPMDGFPEIAFVGRSNVGKSSLVNLLIERRNLALVSKKPGKTQLINHFLVNKRWYLVDLPGYGYASAPKYLCVKWNDFTKDYFLKRKTLVMVVQLIDSSIPVQQIDIDCATWLKEHNIPSTLAFTKCDRKKKKKKTGGKPRHPVDNVADFLQQMRLVTTQTFPWILTSCVSGQGRDELMIHIEEFRNFWHS